MKNFFIKYMCVLILSGQAGHTYIQHSYVILTDDDKFIKITTFAHT